ncbi:MAG: biotin--[acetyl-CoA-carboxylase] ligase [Betaproteobacteria bacterium]
MRNVFIGLGANVGDRVGSLFQARRELAALPGTRLVAVSQLYETEPVGYREQPWFLNQVVELETDLPPQELLEAMLAIEARHGRHRTVRWGPRPLDLDLLLYGSVELSTLALTLPHPRMWQRAFVLLPLAELAPELRTPGGEPVAEAAARLAEEQLLHLWRPRLVGSPLLSLDEVDSTNTEALRLAQGNAAAGTVVVAGSQRKGRGRQGRRWLSPPGLGLYLSALFRPQFLPPSAAPLFTMLGAVAARRAAAALGAPETGLKWPNDLVVEERGTGRLRKLGGVLAEAVSSGQELQAAVLGIGLNLNHRPEDFPPDLRGNATSLAQVTGRSIPANLARDVLLQELNEVYLTFLTRDGDPLVHEFRSHLTTLGQEVHLQHGDRSLHGRAVDVDPLTGALVVECADGQREVCAVGEVSP